MKKIPLQVHCVFAPAGEDMRLLVLRSFSLYLRRVFAENDGYFV